MQHWKMLKLWYFDSDGDMLINYFDSEKEKDDFLNAYGVEEFKSEWL